MMLFGIYSRSLAFFQDVSWAQRQIPENCFTNPLSHETAIANEELPLDLKKTKFPVPMCHIRLTVLQHLHRLEWVSVISNRTDKAATAE